MRVKRENEIGTSLVPSPCYLHSLTTGTLRHMAETTDLTVPGRPCADLADTIV